MNLRLQEDLRAEINGFIRKGYSVTRRNPLTVFNPITSDRKRHNGYDWVLAEKLELQERVNRGTVISAPAPEVFKWNLRHLD